MGNCVSCVRLSSRNSTLSRPSMKLQIRHQLRVVVADEWNEAAFEMVRHCDEAVAKPVHAVCLINRGSRPYDCFAAERSLARLVSDYRFRPPSRVYHVYRV